MLLREVEPSAAETEAAQNAAMQAAANAGAAETVKSDLDVAREAAKAVRLLFVQGWMQ